MANRRMFSKDVVSSDAFVTMSHGAQALYFHFGVYADDDGFVGNPKTLMRLIEADSGHFNELVESNFIIPFQSGVIVIRHWKLNNYLQGDRYKDTIYTEEKTLICERNKIYVYKTDTDCIHSIDKNSKDKNSIEKKRAGKGEYERENHFIQSKDTDLKPISKFLKT